MKEAFVMEKIRIKKQHEAVTKVRKQVAFYIRVSTEEQAENHEDNVRK